MHARTRRESARRARGRRGESLGVGLGFRFRCAHERRVVRTGMFLAECEPGDDAIVDETLDDVRRTHSLDRGSDDTRSSKSNFSAAGISALGSSKRTTPMAFSIALGPGKWNAAEDRNPVGRSQTSERERAIGREGREPPRVLGTAGYRFPAPIPNFNALRFRSTLRTRPGRAVLPALRRGCSA